MLDLSAAFAKNGQDYCVCVIAVERFMIDVQ